MTRSHLTHYHPGLMPLLAMPRFALAVFALALTLSTAGCVDSNSNGDSAPTPNTTTAPAGGDLTGSSFGAEAGQPLPGETRELIGTVKGLRDDVARLKAALEKKESVPAEKIAEIEAMIESREGTIRELERKLETIED